MSPVTAHPGEETGPDGTAARTAWAGRLANESDTRDFGAAIAGRLRAGDVIALRGDLGAGKTALARAIIQARMKKARMTEGGVGAVEVPSPTFNLVLVYEPDDPAAPVLWHFDLYRLDRSEDVFELGIEEALDEGISLIEWPDRLGGLLPEGHVDITLEMGQAEGDRCICVSVPARLAARFGPAAEALGLRPADTGP